MSIWRDILLRAQRAFDLSAEEPAENPFSGCAPDPGDVGFTVAVIGLAAKMARADGAVSADEAAAAARVFQPAPGEARNFERVFTLANETVAGFESYARQIAKRYRARPCLLEDVLDGLFHIALADGRIGAAELSYLARVAELFGISELEFRRIKAANLGPDRGDPYAVLGLLPGATFEDARAAWRRLASENHPDRMTARGAPAEFVRIAEAKTAAINAAFAELQRTLRPIPREAAPVD